ncbi:MAG: polysaccharide deacetylase family protein [Bryobacterales bacterium]|nr:polysaccharide deacetylase family protein [Bryobacterales bacterium]
MLRRLALALALCLPLAAAEKKLILHADDYGMSHSVNVATQELLEKGAISSASIMMPCPWVPEAVNWLKSRQKLDIGLHFTLTSEWKTLRWGPVAPREQVKGLLDPDGYLWPDVRSVAMNATAAEVETELRAQIALAQRMGLRFTHFDTHMGTVYARPDFFEVYLKLGQEFGIPVMLPKPYEGMERSAPAATINYLNSQQTRFASEGVFLLDALIPDGAPGQRSLDGRRKAYHETLRKLQPGITQMILHPGILNDELRAATGSASNRDADYRIFLEPETKALLKELDIELVGWQDVAPAKK